MKQSDLNLLDALSHGYYLSESEVARALQLIRELKKEAEARSFKKPQERTA